ncbi:MAG TPA: MFS transporter [Vicinamibacteria bacterium]|nr:MFS transporter [Vicinamibacteria bacterium]
MAVEQTVARRRRLGVDAGHEHYKWWALSCTSLGMLLATINSGTLIIALPDLERALHTSILSLVWVILAYMISSTVLVLFAGRLSDLFGRKTAYVLGFVLFALASLGAGFAGGGTELIVWRVLQGIGGAFLFANSAALVTDAFPKEQLGLAMGTNTMVAAVGLVIGPVLGGALVAISWHWVFWFNVPFALLGSLWAALILRELAKPDRVRGYDVPGVVVFVLGLTGLVFGLSRGGLNGWTDPWTIGGIVVGIVLLPVFVLIERHHRAPMLDLTIFENRLFAAATGAAFINGLSRFALLFVFVFYFQGVKGQDPITAGIELAPMAIGMLIASPIAGVVTFVVGLTGLTYGLSRAGLSGWGDPLTVAGIVLGVVLLPLFIVVERRVREPMLDLSIFENRLFAAATGAAFINGLSRFALLFLFVFYFQGVKGHDPIRAGIELAPMAIGMLIASPLAGWWADKRGSRALAAWGMFVGAAALAGMTTLGVETPYVWSALWLFVVGVGSGMFNSPNTAAMMGTVPVHRRGIAAGARTMLQNTGAVISIAFVLAVVTSSVDKDTLFKIFSGVTTGLDDATLEPFISNMHEALWILAATSVVGGFVSLLRPPGD